MKPETTAQRIAREAKLKKMCEDLGLTVNGSLVIVMLGEKPIEVDASIINFDQLVPCLMYLAYQKGASEAVAA